MYPNTKNPKKIIASSNWLPKNSSTQTNGSLYLYSLFLHKDICLDTIIFSKSPNDQRCLTDPIILGPVANIIINQGCPGYYHA